MKKLSDYSYSAGGNFLCEYVPSDDEPFVIWSVDHLFSVDHECFRVRTEEAATELMKRLEARRAS